MATHDYVIANGTGAAVRSDLNGALAAIVSQNSSATEPSPTYAYQRWADTTAGVMKMRNGANSAWISLYELDGTFLASDISLAAGSAAAPSLFFTGDTNTGIYSPGADQIGISTGGTSRIVVDGSGNVNIDSNTFYVDAGNNRVGIGTTSPESLLHLNGDVTAFRITRGSAIGFLYNTGTATTDPFRIQSNGGPVDIYTAGSQPITFATGTTERARIDSSGRLLVGTSSARANFINDTASPKLQIEGEVNISAVRTDATAFPSWLILGKTRSTGNTIVQSDDIIGRIAFEGNDGSEFVDAAFISAEVDGTPNANVMPGRLVFSVTADGTASPTESMRINNAGELLVGYTTDNGAYKLQVNSQIFATSATIATSDGRYKENVASLGGCLDLVKALRPVSFTWKPQQDITRTDDEGNEVMVRERHNFPEGTQVGFIAQEVQEVLTDKPWLNSVIKENVRPAVLDSEGNELAPEEQFFGIAEGNLIAVLTNALQEAVAQIETLTDRVAALEAS